MGTTHSGVDFFDVTDSMFDYESPELADARERSWYAETPLGPMVLRHKEADEILRNHRNFGLAGENYVAKHGVTQGPLYDMWMNAIMAAAPDDHARLRGLVNRAFTPRAIERFRPFIRATATRLADHIAREQKCEFMTAFAEPLPAYVMCEMLGVPADDYDLFHECSKDFALAFSQSLDGLLPRVEAAIVELSEYIDDLIVRRRKQLGSDLISSLIMVEERGERLTSAELLNLILQLVWAGQDTTTYQFGRALVAFAEHPDQWELLSAKPKLAERAVEEVCRWSPQLRTAMRFAAVDTEIHGLNIPAGTMILICMVTANRDPRVFEAADRFSIETVRNERQLEFGGGPHTCLGAAVARLEMAEGLVTLASRFGPPTIDGTIVWRPREAMIHGPDVLPLRLAPNNQQ
jgi:cytochrome P450